MEMQQRIHVPGQVYHLVSRCTRSLYLIQQADPDRTIFRACLRRALESADMSLLAYAAMSNHIHLLVRAGEKPMGEFMKSFLCALAFFVNQRLHTRGGITASRYYSVMVDQEAYLSLVMAYVLANPLRAGVATLEGLQSPWTSSLEYARQGGLVDLQAVEELFACKPVDILSFIEPHIPAVLTRRPGWSSADVAALGLAKEELGRQGRYKALQPALGTRTFLNKVARKVDAGWQHVGADGMAVLFRRAEVSLSASLFLEKVLRQEGLADWSLRRRGRPVAALSRARKVALHGLVYWKNYRRAEAFRAVGVSSSAGYALMQKAWCGAGRNLLERVARDAR